MPRIAPFKNHVLQYDEWFIKNEQAYQAELAAVKTLLPKGRGIEIGVGTGRFASQLGIKTGVEPSRGMGALAQAQGITVLPGVAENLPIKDESFDFALLITVLCFLDAPIIALREAHRILKNKGCLLVCFLDRHSPLGLDYDRKKGESVFYKNATFYTSEEVMEMMTLAGFSDFKIRQTVFPDKTDNNVLPGHGKGLFVALRGEK